MKGCTNISSAGNILYDNTQSGMTATDVQDAIDEVNAKFAGREKVEVVAGSGETYASLFNKLIALFDHTKVTENAVIVQFNASNHSFAFFTPVVTEANRIDASRSIAGSGGCSIIGLLFRPNASTAGQWAMASSGNTYTDLSNISLVQGIKVTLYY